MNILEAADISKNFSTTCAVDSVSLEVQSGEECALRGPNGAGKTTTLRMVLDILKPDSGTIEVVAKPLNQKTKDQIGYLPEERDLLLMVQKGSRLPYGSAGQVRERFALNAVYVVGEGDWAALPGAARGYANEKETDLLLTQETTRNDSSAPPAGNPTYRMMRFQVVVPSRHDFFVTAVDGDPIRP